MNRTLWMFPRNKRTAFPFDVAMMLRVLSNVIADEPNTQLSQSTQDQITQTFRDLGLADGGDLRDLQSGGFRTYEAYLRQLGLTFKAPHPDTGRLTLTRLTVSGQEIAELNDPATRLRINLLRTQFPHPYSVGPRVRIRSGVAVKPVVFVFEMLADPRMEGYVTDLDLAQACVYGRTHESLCDVVRRCVDLRATLSRDPGLDANEELARSIDDLRRDVYAHRSTDPVKTLSQAGQDIRDISDTLIQRMYSTGLLVRVASPRGSSVGHHYLVNRGVLELVDKIRREPMTFSDAFRTTEDWQRNFGRGSLARDMRRNTVPGRMSLSSPIDRVRDEALKKYRTEGTLFDFDEFVGLMASQTRLRRVEIERIVQGVLPDAETDLERQLYEAASDPDLNNRFERQVTELLRFKFPEAFSRHTGQLRHPGEMGNYADVFFRSINLQCLIADTKASRRPYALGVGDRSKMLNHINNSSSLFESDGEVLECAVFVSAQITDQAPNYLQGMVEKSGVPVGLLTVRNLIDHVNNCAPDSKKFVSSLKQGQVGRWSA